jgi:two-component system, NtrC family, response regulator AtoC
VMQRLHELLSRVAAGGVNVLLLGETGVGKEVFARRLHALSPRAQGPLVELNCAAFPEQLLESELFGHEKGAFTGVDRRKTGLLEAASGGIAFLDELGELPAPAQAKLLRVIEEGRLRRVGGTSDIAIDVLFLGATNRDLEAEVAAGRFRADLYYRLNGFALTIPPLRERRAEVIPLAERFAAAAARRMGISRSPALSEEAVELLNAYPWPGNIRELRNAIDRAVLLSDGAPITGEHLPAATMRVSAPGTLERALAGAVASAGAPPAGLSEDELAERQRIIDALASALGNQTRAAEALGISRRWLSTKMARYRIPRPRTR